MGDVIDWIGDAEQGAILFAQTSRTQGRERQSGPDRIEARGQHIRGDVAEVGVDAPATADDVAAVAADVEHGAEPWLNVVAVRPRLLPKVLEHRAREAPGLPGGLH